MLNFGLVCLISSLNPINFEDVLAGNGPKEIDIREVIEREGTEDRVALGKSFYDKYIFNIFFLFFFRGSS